MVLHRASPGGRRARDRAFTLMELIVVTGLLGLVLGLISLKLDGLLPGTRLKAASRELASHLEMCRNYSVVARREVLVQYDLPNARYRAFYPYELDDDGKTILGQGETTLIDWQSLPDTIRFKDVRLGEGDQIDSGIVTVRFEPRGVATGHVAHLMRDETETFYSVVVSPLLGYVDLVSGYHEPEVLDEDAL